MCTCRVGLHGWNSQAIPCGRVDKDIAALARQGMRGTVTIGPGGENSDFLWSGGDTINEYPVNGLEILNNVYKPAIRVAKFERFDEFLKEFKAAGYGRNALNLWANAAESMLKSQAELLRDWTALLERRMKWLIVLAGHYAAPTPPEPDYASRLAEISLGIPAKRLTQAEWNAARQGKAEAIRAESEKIADFQLAAKDKDQAVRRFLAGFDAAKATLWEVVSGSYTSGLDELWKLLIAALEKISEKVAEAVKAMLAGLFKGWGTALTIGLVVVGGTLAYLLLRKK